MQDKQQNQSYKKKGHDGRGSIAHLICTLEVNLTNDGWNYLSHFGRWQYKEPGVLLWV